MSIKIAQAYFENNLSMQANDFDLIDGFYSRTLPENELEIGFDDAEDGECDIFILDYWANAFCLQYVYRKSSFGAEIKSKLFNSDGLYFTTVENIKILL